MDFRHFAGAPQSDPLVLRLKCRFGIETELATMGPVNDCVWKQRSRSERTGMAESDLSRVKTSTPLHFLESPIGDQETPRL
jgi:hypothetical protein